MKMIRYSLPDRKGFRQILNGAQCDLYTIANETISLSATSYGARLVSLITKDKEGNDVDVVLGFASVDEYITAHDPYYGAIVGRIANRIKNGTFSLNGKEYHIPINNGPNTLHGGPKGFHAQMWQTAIEEDSITFSRIATDGEEGFPGEVEVKVKYSLNENVLRIEYWMNAKSDTVISLSNHAYWNLSGEGSQSILDHKLFINANTYTPVDGDLIPIGTRENVNGTPFDFLHEKEIGSSIDYRSDQLINGKGYDHNWVLNNTKALRIFSPVSGIAMEIDTDSPGIQFYSGNYLNGNDIGRSGNGYGYRSAFVLEPQQFPNAVNEPSFGNIVLRTNEVRTSWAEYRFFLNSH